MLKPSVAIQKAYHDHKDVEYTITVTLTNNTVITFTEDDLVLGGCNVLRDNGGDVFPFGYVYCSQLTLSVYDKPAIQNVNFKGATVVISGDYDYGGENDYLFSNGTYTITQADLQGSIYQLIGYDDIGLTDKPCAITTGFPKKATTLFEQCCYDCGISYDTSRVYNGVRCFPSGWANDNTMIPSMPDNLSYRQVMGMCAMFFGANVYISPFDNYVYVLPLKDSSSATLVSFWGGIFDDGTPRYATGDEVDGGTFDPWNTGAAANAGTFGDDLDVVYLNDPLNHPKMALNDVTIGGVRVKIDQTEYTNTGASGYIINVENPLIIGNEQTLLDKIGASISGMKFRPFELEYTAYPWADLSQRVQFVDIQGRVLPSLITSIDMDLKGITRFKCTAESQDRADSKSSYRSAYKRADEVLETSLTAISNQMATVPGMIQTGLTSYDTEMQRMVKLMANAFGAYQTKDVQQDGSVIYYMHDKSTLASSTNIWKMTSQGFTVSSDGGQTWTAGMDASGKAVVNILSAIGVKADWITAGIIYASNQRGYWNLNTGVFGSNETDRSLKLNDGHLYFYNYLGELSGRLFSAKDYVSHGRNLSTKILAVYGEEALCLGHMEGSNAVYNIFINHDLTGEHAPGDYKGRGYQERIQLYGTVRADSRFYAFAITMDAKVSNITNPYTTSGNIVFRGYLNNAGALDYYRGYIGSPDGNPANKPLVVCGSETLSLGIDKMASNEFNEILRMAYNDGASSNDSTYARFFSKYTTVNELIYTKLTPSSDINKKNVHKWNKNYDSILDDFEPIEYTWKDDPDGLHKLGFSAQQILEVLHNHGIKDSAVSKVGEVTGLDYDSIITLLVKRVQEQTKTIETLKERVDKLEKMMEVLL